MAITGKLITWQNQKLPSGTKPRVLGIRRMDGYDQNSGLRGRIGTLDSDTKPTLWVLLFVFPAISFFPASSHPSPCFSLWNSRSRNPNRRNGRGDQGRIREERLLSGSGRPDPLQMYHLSHSLAPPFVSQTLFLFSIWKNNVAGFISSLN